ncbi:MAG: hypothetical protein IT287_09080 [Bdellovibrionaceae bacterium]|nr:hypothetical protein [Pseudobdellovibrionaceae bacterium]
MKLFTSIIMLYSLTACSHWSAPVSQAGGKESFFTFQTVTLPAQRDVANDAKKNKKTDKQPEQKFVAVYKCEKGAACAETDANKKMVPYDQFVAQVKEKAMQKGFDVVDKQQHMLAKGIDKLKQQRAEVTSENNYYKHQLQFYRYASLRPVVQNYKKAQRATEEEVKLFNAKIDKYEKDLDYLKNVKGIRIGMDTNTEKIMELVEVGQWKFGEDSDETVVWEFLQQVGYDLAKN